MAAISIQRIHRLPDTVINQIAAGEVIERPVSVVKELLENSLDAGARHLTIEVAGGGGRMIRVMDDGHGIHEEDLRLAVDRHTTSKLSRAEDLARIGTLGFRGEALSSIAAVSRLILTTRQEGTEHGWMASLAAGDSTPVIKPAPHPVGTTVEVRDLFYNTPARRKFLRSEQSEFLHIQELVGLQGHHDLCPGPGNPERKEESDKNEGCVSLQRGTSRGKSSRSRGPQDTPFSAGGNGLVHGRRTCCRGKARLQSRARAFSVGTDCCRVGGMHGTSPSERGWRFRLHEVIFEADTSAGRAFDLLLLVTILLSIAAVLLESVNGIRTRYGPELRAAEWAFTLLFSIEYVLRLLSVRQPRHYVRSFFGIVDLMAVLPTYLSVILPGSQSLLVIRALRLLRIFRILSRDGHDADARFCKYCGAAL